jgi:hypothetical protein
MKPTTIIAALSTSEPRIPAEILAAARPQLSKLAKPLRHLVENRLADWEATQQAPATLDCLYALALLVEGGDAKAGPFCLKLADQSLHQTGFSYLPAPVQAALLPGLLAHAAAPAPASLFDWFFHDEAPIHRLVPMQMTLLLLANCYGQRSTVIAGLGQALANLHSGKDGPGGQNDRLLQIAELAGRLQATELHPQLATFTQTGELDPDDWEDVLAAFRQPRQRQERRLQQQVAPFLFSTAETFFRGRLGGRAVGDDLWIPDRIEKFLGQRLDRRMAVPEILRAIGSDDLTLALPALRAARHERQPLTPILLAFLDAPGRSASCSPASLFHAMLLLGEFAEPRAHPLLFNLPLHHPDMQAIFWGRSQTLHPWCWSLRRCGGDPGQFFRHHAAIWPATDQDLLHESQEQGKDGRIGAAELALDDFLRSPAGRSSAAQW